MGAGLWRVAGAAGWSQMSRPHPRPAFPGLGTQAQLQTMHTKLREAQSKLIEQESALKELSERGEGRTLP